MKKLIAILLVLAALLGVCSAAFTDEKDITDTYAEAVNAMVEAKVISGFPDGTFQPKGTLTRAQAAKIITVLLEGDKAETVTAAAAGFADVPAGNWAEKYVNYCAEKGIVAGVGNGKFDPNGQLKGSQWAKMLLVAYGHPADELTGSKWFSNTQKAIKEKGMNKNVAISDSPTSREKACQLAYNFYHVTQVQNFETNVLAPAGYKETTISLANAKNVKLLGRAEATEKGIVTNFSAEGIEFTLDCGGTMKLTVDVKDEYNAYQLFVDGEPVSSTMVKTSELVLADLIQPGEHTIRIVQDKGVNTSGKVNTISAITVSTKGGEMKATPLKDLYIEFVGASTEAGSGTMGGHDDAYTYAVHSATHAYTYVTAQLMDADYSIVAIGGIGILKKAGSHAMNTLYWPHNAYRDTERAYDFARKPDVIVTTMPTSNDKDSDEVLYAESLKFVKELREKNGKDCKIVFISGLMSDKPSRFLAIKQRIAEELGGEKAGFYTVSLPVGTDGVPANPGGTGHPSAENCKMQAAALAEFLKGILK